MWLWAWFTGGGWILVAGGAVVLGLVAAAVVVGATARKRAYPGRHVLFDPQESTVEEIREAGEQFGRAFYGSMTLDEEREFLTTVPGTRMTIWAPSGEVEFSEEPGWREQTAADLSPEALDGGPTVSGPEGATGVNAPSVQPDSGPGEVVPPASGPVYDVGYFSLPAETQQAVEWALCERDPDPGWLDRQLALHVAWVARMAPLVTGWGLAA